MLFVYESSVLDESGEAFPDMVAEQVAVEHWEKQMSWVVAEQVAVEHWEKQMSWVVAEQVAANWVLLHVKLKSCFLPLIRDSQGRDSVFSPLF